MCYPCTFEPIEPTEGHVAALRFVWNKTVREVHMTEQDAHDVINIIRAQLIANSQKPLEPKKDHE